MEKETQDDGVLDSTFRADGPDADEGLPGDETPAEPTAPEGQPQKVSLSRREKARERDERLFGEVRSMREESEKRDREYREHLEAVRRENAELRGYMSRPQPQQEQRRDDSQDPERLAQEAIEALDRRDFAGYQKKTIAAAKAEAIRELSPRFAQQQPQQPQTNPMLMAVAAQYGDVMANPEAMEMTQAHDRILGRRGIPDGPERWKQGFEVGRQYLKGNKPAGSQYSQRNREVVSGLPTNGTNPGRPGGGEPGVILTAAERATAKRYRMSEQDYAQNLAEAHPERLIK